MSPRGRSGRTGRGRVGIVWWLGLCLLLVLPASALSRLANRLDWRIVAGVPLALSLATYLAYWSDKRRAEKRAWRWPEATLQLAGLLGGWPGGLLAQRKLRHKTAKMRFQVTFWLIVTLHQFLAADYLMDWLFLGRLVRLVWPNA